MMQGEQTNGQRPTSLRISWTPCVVLAIAGLLLAVSSADAFSFDRSTRCERLQRQRGHDQWAVLEYRIEAGTSRLPDVSLEFSSDAEFANQLMYCVERQQTLLPRDGTGQHILFRFQPADDLVEAKGERRLRFQSPSWLRRKLELDGYSGNLAVRMEMAEDGTIRSKEVLFSSDYELGQWVLDSLDEAIVVEARGEARQYVDVLYLRLGNRGVTFFEQLHYKNPSSF